MSNRIMCENCNKKYTPRNIENHKIKCCTYSKCDFCNKVLSSPYNLQVHLQKCKIKINLSYENLLKEKIDLEDRLKILEEDNNKIFKKCNLLEEENILLKNEKIEVEGKIKIYESENMSLKLRVNTLETQNSVEQKYIQKYEENYKEMCSKMNTTLNINNLTNANNNITLKQVVSKLEPISYDEIKDSMSLFTNEYIDDGVIGFARFLCEHSCNSKIVTTDKSRNTIAYRTKFNDFIKDPECLNLINKTLQDNAQDIIRKTQERSDYYRSMIDNDDDIDIYFKKGAKINELKKLTESSLTEKPDDNIKKMSGLLCNHGIKTYQKTMDKIKI